MPMSKNGKVNHLLPWVGVLFIFLALVPWGTDYIEAGHWPTSAKEMLTEVVGSTIIILIGFFLFRNLEVVRKQRMALELLAITDPITSLFNLRHFYAKLQEEILRAKRQKTYPALLFIDIDRFKSYNDTYGHQAGDQILKSMGTLVVSSIREGMDSGFRYGGDGFAIILPATVPSQALAVAERLRNAFLENTGCSISIGVAVMKDDDDVSTLLARADAAMYRAKREGANCVHLQEE